MRYGVASSDVTRNLATDTVARACSRTTLTKLALAGSDDYPSRDLSMRDFGRERPAIPLLKSRDLTVLDGDRLRACLDADVRLMAFQSLQVSREHWYIVLLAGPIGLRVGCPVTTTKVIGGLLTVPADSRSIGCLAPEAS